MTYEYEQYLAHHGIKGQKWGVRRYQNEDGSLTEEGIKRYQKAEDLRNKYYKTKHEAMVGSDKKWHSLNKKADKYAKKANKIDQKTIDKIDIEKYRKSVLGDKYDEYKRSKETLNKAYEEFSKDRKAKEKAAAQLFEKRKKSSWSREKYNKMSKAERAQWIKEIADAFDYSIDAHDDLYSTYVTSIPKYKKADEQYYQLMNRFNDFPFSEYLRYKD